MKLDEIRAPRLDPVLRVLVIRRKPEDFEPSGSSWMKWIYIVMHLTYKIWKHPGINSKKYLSNCTFINY